MSDSTNETLERELKLRKEFLFVRGLRMLLSRRKSKDGSLAYQEFLNKLDDWSEKQRIQRIRIQED